MKSFSEKTVLITGASSGIGYQIALDFAQNGSRLILVARRHHLLKELAEKIKESGGKVDAITCDLAEVPSREKLITEISSRFGCPDVLINNAGYGNYRPFVKETPVEIARMMEVNYTAAAHLMAAFLPGMIERGSGAIVNVASGAGMVAVPFMGIYCAAKFALRALTEALSYEMQNSGVTVHLVNPGPVRTEFFDAGVWEGKTHEKMVTPAQVSRVVQAAILKNRPLSYVPPKRGVLVYVFNLLGPLGRWVMRRKAAKDPAIARI